MAGITEGKGAEMKKLKLGKVEKTERGFEVVNFKDHYGTRCSLQASSLAIYKKPGTSAIWLGVDDANPQVLHGDAAALGVKTDATCGWVKYPLSDKVHLTTRMHLNREQVEALIPMLQNWLKRDTFKNLAGHDPFKQKKVNDTVRAAQIRLKRRDQ